MKTPVFVPICLLAVCGLIAPQSASAQDAPKPIKALLVTGGCCHDYDGQKDVLTQGISALANVEWTVVHEGGNSTGHKVSIYSDPDWAKGYDVVVHDECFADVKDAAFVEGILKPHRSGVPAVNLHCTMHCYRVGFDTFTEWFAFTGLDTRGHGPQLPIEITNVNTNHPVTIGLENWTTINEELYNNLKVWDTVTPLSRGKQTVKNKDGTTKDVDALVTWVNNYHGTRVFGTTLGHNTATVADPRYLQLVTRGLLWACDKLDENGNPKPGYEAKK
ncbi:MAG TPA: ThuA domain-containing protein [Verrucomicrobiota bacterium]|nr:ThuA domain-containing protein [Verrucomicrobiota bacterium]